MATSALYNTQAWPQHAHQKDYLNQAIALQTHLTAQDLLHQTQAIEKQLGRTRKQKWEARLIDIDILFYNEVILESKSLTLPHPRLHTRKFALTPLCEIARNYIHPILKKSIAELLKECTDPLRIELFTKP
jgi:2-amino-4-hydroxy-6-hydroxymethyldihydropteridine diphosphokinase